jgi:ABC-type bacteriocin/lantibiotic exporter with double-glycine peptidase domain
VVKAKNNELGDKFMQNVSINNLFMRFKWRVSLTLLLVIAESGVYLLFPLFIGFAINDLIDKSYEGLINLLIIGFLMLFIGSARRFYDTRIYAGIYTIISKEMVAHEQEKNSSLSKISARTSLLTEFIEFLENSLPELAASLIGLFGILIIIFFMNINVFFACLALLGLVVLIYLFSGKLNFRLNKEYNNQLERQVELLSTQDMNLIGKHFQKLMSWNIKLSDLETFNFSLVFIGILGLLAYAPIAVIESGVLAYGLVFSILIYVFDYIESVVNLPLYIQQIIRLQEISNRLKE